MDLTERLGLFAGWTLAAITGPGAFVRRARFFHPEGLVFRARVEPAGHGRGAEVGRRLAGPALVRFSGAWWRRHEWKDVLGIALRFRDDGTPTPTPEPRDQDLLFATIRSPWTTPVAALPTRSHDFLKNHFHAVSPFEVDGGSRVKLRLASPRWAPLSGPGPSRAERLRADVAEGRAVLTLQLRPLLRPLLRTARWEDVARVVVEQEVALDQAALRFDPFRGGRGLVPRGFVHALRVATYAASQGLRPASRA